MPFLYFSYQSILKFLFEETKAARICLLPKPLAVAQLFNVITCIVVDSGATNTSVWVSIYTKSLVRADFIGAFFICVHFQTVPKYLVHAVYHMFDRVNPSYLCKIVMICIIDFICAFLVSAEFF